MEAVAVLCVCGFAFETGEESDQLVAYNFMYVNALYAPTLPYDLNLCPESMTSQHFWSQMDGITEAQLRLTLEENCSKCGGFKKGHWKRDSSCGNEIYHDK